jgi:hypothetical protein
VSGWGAVQPEAIYSARTAASFGCIGNRVYAGADDTEAYFAIPGAQLRAVEEHLAIIVRANEELEKFHREQQHRSLGHDCAGDSGISLAKPWRTCQ